MLNCHQNSTLFSRTYANPSSMSNLQHKFLQIMKGANVVGRTQPQLLRTLGLPKHLLPASLKLIAQGIQASDECFNKITIITKLIKLKAD